MPLILPGNVATATAVTTYDVANSCRFEDGDTPLFTRTTETPTNIDKYTFSVWVKRGNLGIANCKLFSIADGTYGEEKLEFNEDDLIWRQTHPDDGEIEYQRITDRKFRDPSAWMHIFLAYDSSDGTAGDRMKMYINGVQETSFSASADPDSNEDSYVNAGSKTLVIGRHHNSGHHFDGYMAELVFIDGVAHAVTDFGEFDGDSPTIWKPKDVSGLTFGNNGFYCDFEDSSALGNDVSGNNNDLGVTNLDATDSATDTPTNNFATMNPLGVTGATSFANFSNGNLTYTGNSSTYGYVASTIGMTTGKWIFEAKLTQKPNTNTEIGIADLPSRTNTQMLGVTDPNSISYRGNGEVYKNNSSLTWSGSTYALNEIIGIALDLDNNRLFFSINGTWQNSADPTTSTGAISITAPEALGTTGAYFFAVGDQIGYDTAIWQCNFGNPSFSISSGNADGNGYGNFEYAVPSSYYSLCSANLAEFG